MTKQEVLIIEMNTVARLNISEIEKKKRQAKLIHDYSEWMKKEIALNVLFDSYPTKEEQVHE